MRTIFIAFVLIVFLGSCNSKQNHKGPNTKSVAAARDSQKKGKTVDSQTAVNDTSDSDEDEPSFSEVLAERLASYNKIENVDTLVIDGKETLHLHETYYCLHDSAAVVPKRYLWGGDTTKDFVTHNFASKIVILNNNKTIFNKIIKKSDFNGILNDQLKKHAILFDSNFDGYNKTKGEFMFAYSISIPLTDVGVAVHLIIDKKGGQKIMDEFTFINKFQKN